VDAANHAWIFGGLGMGSAGGTLSQGYLNDLWMFNGTEWTWKSGPSSPNQPGNHGNQGVAASTNLPGGRVGAMRWTGPSGQLFLFGGYSCDDEATPNQGSVNDLWSWNGTGWTWIGGSSALNPAGSYATKGTVGANMPGGRDSGTIWRDSKGNTWLFGGFGFDGATGQGALNDLWKFDGTNWIWVSGSSTVEQSGSYGTLGAPDPANVPGARGGSPGWIDASDHLWLFGGMGYDSAGTYGTLNDLWEFDGSYWTWVSGSKLAYAGGVYGTRGTATASTVPPGRDGAAVWVDGSGAFWLFGGITQAGANTYGGLNDLWKLTID